MRKCLRCVTDVCPPAVKNCSVVKRKSVTQLIHWVESSKEVYIWYHT